MNFYDLKDEVAEEFGITKDLSRKIMSFLLKRMQYHLFFGTEISFRLIGTFRLLKRDPKPFKHLKTGKMEMSKKSYYLKFKVSKRMAEKLKGKTVY